MEGYCLGMVIKLGNTLGRKKKGSIKKNKRKNRTRDWARPMWNKNIRQHIFSLPFIQFIILNPKNIKTKKQKIKSQIVD